MLNGNESEKPGIEEQYQTATNGSPVLISAGMIQVVKDGDAPPPLFNGTRLGLAMLRLHSEFDSAAKPKRLGKDAIAALTAILKTEDAKAKAQAERKGAPYKSPGSAATRAAAQAQAWYAGELQILAQSLKSRAVVWEQLNHWRALKSIPADTVAAALAHWLNPTCPVCDGHGLRKVEDQPALSARQCYKCHGSGHLPRPHGTGPVLSYFDDCVQKARTSLKNRLHRK